MTPLAASDVAREVLVGMRRRGSGHLVTVTSLVARLAWPGMIASSAARTAMEGLSAAQRADLYGTGIGVTLAMFGTVESRIATLEVGRGWAGVPPELRLLTPTEVADAVAAGAQTRRRRTMKPTIVRLLFLLIDGTHDTPTL